MPHADQQPSTSLLENAPYAAVGEWLRRGDQWVVAILTVLALAAMPAIGGFFRGDFEEAAVGSPSAAMCPARFQLDINSADWPELVQLPAIAETRAKTILDSRRADGPFVSADDLERIRGIGPKTVAKMKPFLLPIAETRNNE